MSNIEFDDDYIGSTLNVNFKEIKSEMKAAWTARIINFVSRIMFGEISGNVTCYCQMIR